MSKVHVMPVLFFLFPLMSLGQVVITYKTPNGIGLTNLGTPSSANGQTILLDAPKNSSHGRNNTPRLNNTIKEELYPNSMLYHQDHIEVKKSDKSNGRAAAIESCKIDLPERVSNISKELVPAICEHEVLLERYSSFSPILGNALNACFKVVFGGSQASKMLKWSDCTFRQMREAILNPKFEKCQEVTKSLNIQSMYCNNNLSLEEITADNFQECFNKIIKLKEEKRENDAYMYCKSPANRLYLSSKRVDACLNIFSKVSMKTEAYREICLSEASADLLTDEWSQCVSQLDKKDLNLNRIVLCLNPKISTYEKCIPSHEVSISETYWVNELLKALKNGKNNLYYFQTKIRNFNHDCKESVASPFSDSNIESDYFRFLKSYTYSSFDGLALNNSYLNGKKFIRLGGLSGLAYDKRQNLLLAVSDDNMAFLNGEKVKPRIYRFRLDNLIPKLLDVKFINPEEQSSNLDLEAISLMSNGQMIVSSESGVFLNKEILTEYQDASLSEKEPNFLNILDINFNIVGKLDIPLAFERNFEDGPSAETKNYKEEHAVEPHRSAFQFLMGNDTQTKKPLNDDKHTQQLELNRDKYDTLPSKRVSQGMRSNKGIEGLSVSPSEQFMFVMNEGTLVQDKCVIFKKDSSTKKNKIGDESYTSYGYEKQQCKPQLRLVRYESYSKKFIEKDEYFYLAEGPEENGVSEILALNDDTLLILERFYDYSQDRINAKVFLVNLKLSTKYTVKQFENGDRKDISYLTKKLVLDFSKVIPQLPPGLRKIDNLEGMTLGPKLQSGNPSIIFVSDNNFSDKQITQFIFFEISKKLFERQAE